MNADDITSCLQLHNIDTIIHLAAQSNVDASLKNPASFAATNIVGTQVMLECAKACNVRKFVQMSSYEVYGATKCGNDGHGEDEALIPMNPYGGGKAAAEMLVTAFGHCNTLETLIVRTNNIYGPNQYPDSLSPGVPPSTPALRVACFTDLYGGCAEIIPKFIMLLQHREKLTLHGGGMQRKRYLYAGDAANAFNVLLHRGIAGEIYNLGSSNQISNRDFAATLLDYVNLGSSDSSSDSLTLDLWIETMPGRPYTDSNSGLDCKKLRGLGWEPHVSWEEGLRRTVEWYSRFGDTWWKAGAGKS